ncbi:YwaF family protein [Paenibacillus cymbidii]|uniref:YwaF family protein n=1 Tax=Paenibacillus cymbidii TaxID=1639034 RepID=UPI001080ADA8|nr:TIGR02206 family membrane protein [Paenibacillus cymbidii]
MGRYFGADDTDLMFVMLSNAHIAALVAAVVLLSLLVLGRRRLRRTASGERVRHGLAAGLVLSEVVLQIWHVANGEWAVDYGLPLQLCSVTLLLSAVMLWTRSYRLFECLYFAGIGGALQALLTPNLAYTFPHLIYFHFFLAHIGIIAASLYMVLVCGFRPTLGSIGRTMLYLNVYAVVVIIVNRLTGSNYMFLARKPSTASLIDYLGPWPWYIGTMELVALVIFALLYVPFARKRSETMKG